MIEAKTVHKDSFQKVKSQKTRGLFIVPLILFYKDYLLTALDSALSLLLVYQTTLAVSEFTCPSEILEVIAHDTSVNALWTVALRLIVWYSLGPTLQATTDSV